MNLLVVHWVRWEARENPLKIWGGFCHSWSTRKGPYFTPPYLLSTFPSVALGLGRLTCMGCMKSTSKLLASGWLQWSTMVGDGGMRENRVKLLIPQFPLCLLLLIDYSLNLKRHSAHWFSIPKPNSVAWDQVECTEHRFERTWFESWLCHYHFMILTKSFFFFPHWNAVRIKCWNQYEIALQNVNHYTNKSRNYEISSERW